MGLISLMTFYWISDSNSGFAVNVDRAVLPLDGVCFHPLNKLRSKPTSACLTFCVRIWGWLVWKLKLKPWDVTL